MSSPIDPEEDFNQNTMNWRQGEGASLQLVKATGDPKAYGEKLRDKIEEKRKLNETSS